MLNFSQLVALEHSLRGTRVLSVYLDGTASDPAQQRAWRVQLDHSLDDLRVWLTGSPHAEREDFEQCVRLLDHELEAFTGNVEAHGWAAFITADRLHEASPLPVTMPTQAVWSTGISMAPYMRALKEIRPVAIVLVDSKRADVNRYYRGKIEHIETLHAHHTVMQPSHMGDAPRPGFHSGTRGATGHDEAQESLLAGTNRMLADAAESADSGGTTGLGALGPTATRETLDQRRVRDLFLTHRYLENHAAEAEDAVRSAIDQGAMVEEVSGAAAEQLDAHGGMAARLRYRVAYNDSAT